MTKTDMEAAAYDMLRKVGLEESYFHRRPSQLLSAGEHRTGADHESGIFGGGRAGVGPGRNHPGPDHGAAAEASGGAAPGLSVHLP